MKALGRWALLLWTRSGGASLAMDRRAATAVIFALTITPVLGFVALAFDVGSAVWTRGELDLAADAAALTAVDKGANDLAGNPATSFQPAQQAGVSRFAAQASTMPGVTLGPVAVGVTSNGGTVTAQVTYAATYKTRFAGLFGFGTLPARGTATAMRTISPYFEISILMDDSSSMAIAASQAGMTQLGALVRASPLFAAWGQNQNCAFGCHFDAKNNDFYGLAESNGIPLRIDVLRQAVENVITKISASPTATKFNVALYSFDTGFHTVFASSGDLAAALIAAQGVTVPVTTAGNDADTNIPLALQSVTAGIPASGDGSSAAAPRRYLFIITDGVADYFNASGQRVIAPFDPALCAALKAKGVQIMTLYTQYIPLEPPSVPTSNAFYVANVKPFVGQLQPNLQACASSASYAFQATDGASIDAALQTMLQTALNTPARFTQ